MPAEEEFDTEFTDAPVCPHCGEEQSEASEVHGHHETARLQCGSCEEMFDSVQRIEVTYSTYAIDHEAEALAEAKTKEQLAARYAACQEFPPGTRVRIRDTSLFHAHYRGQEGVVANRELSRHNPLVRVLLRLGDRDSETSAFPDELEILG